MDIAEHNDKYLKLVSEMLKENGYAVQRMDVKKLCDTLGTRIRPINVTYGVEIILHCTYPALCGIESEEV